ncbi:MAG: dTDP-4-dehydrorhamnose reductase [Betaproteobacteria bacterium]|nr:dTDP-4-dehydrorhamnose reductase [Betaproteobacteria bacterium]MDE2424226.1 dTDP-4-dehydrorhamnose reductase [Betaproteobacteria bacterium]
MKILITGANGQLAQSLALTLAPLGNIIALDRKGFDLSHLSSSLHKLSEIKPDLIINAGAYTAVDRAETEEALAFQINAHAPGALAQYCRSAPCALIHYSTDYVFNGQKSSAYVEDDITDPINVYGKSKREGEIAILKEDCPALIFRTSWVYSLEGQNFLTTMLRLGQERDEVRVINDQWGSPTSTQSLAQATLALLQQKPNHLSLVDYFYAHRGIYHMTNQQFTSWFGFAQAIFDLRPSRAKLTAIASHEYPTAAKRPTMSCLDNSKLKEHFDITLPDWHDALRECLKVKS